jgi:hypothetical protein
MLFTIERKWETGLEAWLGWFRLDELPWAPHWSLCMFERIVAYTCFLFSVRLAQWLLLDTSLIYASLGNRSR